MVVESSMACLGALLTLPAMIPEGGAILALAGSEDTRANPASRLGDEGSAPYWRLPALWRP